MTGIWRSLFPKLTVKMQAAVLRYRGREIETVANAGAQFDLFHPLHYIEPDNPLLSDTLILCTRDFQAVNKMFPWWGLSGEVFGRMVLVDPSDAEIEQLQKLFYEQKGILYTGISTEDFTQITTSASIRAHRLYILFYLLSGALLVILLICNIIRIIETHVASTRCTTFTVLHPYHSRRVGGFVLLLHILPIIGIVFVMFRNEMALWYALPLCMAFVTGLCRFAAVYAGKRIGTMNSLQNLRRDY